MIEVLQSRSEIEEACNILKRKRLLIDPETRKNWDLYLLHRITRVMRREINIIDLGCAGLLALRMLRLMGFRNLYGVDLNFTWKMKLKEIFKTPLTGTFEFPYRLYMQDVTNTKFSNDFFDLAICTSVIEHGVDAEQFFAETKRILKTGGVLFITLDYWSEKINVKSDFRPFGLKWQIFSEEEIVSFIELSNRYGFILFDALKNLDCTERCVEWNNASYTFICIVLKKI